MEATIDSGGRILLPKSIRDSLGFSPGSKVDISVYGDCIQITPGGCTARLEQTVDGRLVSEGSTPVTDEMLFALIDAGRR